MLMAFKRSKLAAGAVLILTLAAMILIWIRDRGRELYIPVIASLLLAGVGVLAAILLGNILANMENTRYLGYLHMELDPDRFLAAYRDVPARLKEGSRSQAIARSYLADGYWAKGDFASAIQTLGESPARKDPAMAGLYAAKECAYLQAMGNHQAAEESLQCLENIVSECKKSKPDLARNLSESLRIYQEQQHVLKGESMDREVMQRAFQKAQYNLRRLEIARVFQLEERNGGPAVPKEIRKYLKNQSGQTFFRNTAA